MAKQEFEQGDSNVIVRNQVVYGALPQDVIDRMGDTTLALQTTEQNVLPAINELKSNLTQNTINVFTNSASKITKENGRCTLIFGYSDSVPNLLGATLPEGYRPSEALSTIVLVYSNSSNKIYLGYVTLSTAGTFTFYYSGSYGQARESISGADWRIIGELVYYTN